MENIERRFVELRIGDNDTLTGVVLRYGDRASFGGFTEEFRAGSLSYDDVIVNLQHDRSKPVARTGAGLVLADDEHELRASIKLPDTTYAREARELVNAKIIRGLSLEFRSVDDTWTGKHRVINKATMTGFALVDRPAYSDSQIADRFMLVHTQPGSDGDPRPQRRYYY